MKANHPKSVVLSYHSWIGKCLPSFAAQHFNRRWICSSSYLLNNRPFNEWNLTVQRNNEIVFNNTISIQIIPYSAHSKRVGSAGLLTSFTFVPTVGVVVVVTRYSLESAVLCCGDKTISEQFLVLFMVCLLFSTIFPLCMWYLWSALYQLADAQ